MTAPPGWVGRYVTMEESDLANMEWSADGGAAFDIAPGATAAGFSVKVAAHAPEYHTARFDVVLANSAHVAGSLEPDSLPSDER